MVIFRVVAALLLLATVLAVGAFLFTHDRRYLRWAVNLLKALVITGFAFFALLLLERAVVAL